MNGFVPSRVVGSPAVDDEGYPLNGYDEVVPGLAQADTMFTPTSSGAPNDTLMQASLVPSADH